jgi:type I restriction enzyme S subunit
MLVRVDRSRLHPHFLASWLALSETKEYIESFNAGGSRRAITKGHIERFEVPLPPFAVQEAIGSLAAVINRRVESLRQTNATLEAIAQALFKSWFVDFDPVRAKADGREPEGMDAATAALFPSEFEASELGLIPRGWTIARLDEHVEAERGLSYKGAGLADQESGLPMHNLNSVLEGGGYKYAGIKFYKGDFKERHIAQAGDVVVANTEQGHHHRLIGFPAIVPRKFQRGLFSHHLYRVRIRDDSPITRHWIYRALMAPRVRDQIAGCANGSTVNMLKPAGLQIPRFVLPPGPLCEKFEGLAVALHDRMETNVDLADSLAALRDTLLPRLISGKLRLPEAEKLIEEAVA